MKKDRRSRTGDAAWAVKKMALGTKSCSRAASGMKILGRQIGFAVPIWEVASRGQRLQVELWQAAASKWSHRFPYWTPGRPASEQVPVLVLV